MIVENPYRKMLEYVAGHQEQLAGYVPEKNLVPQLTDSAGVFDRACATQLARCVLDLRLWAGVYAKQGRKEIAQELLSFAGDWEEDARLYDRR